MKSVEQRYETAYEAYLTRFGDDPPIGILDSGGVEQMLEQMEKALASGVAIPVPEDEGEVLVF